MSTIRELDPNHFHPYIAWKTVSVQARASLLCAMAVDLMNEMAIWCESRKLPFVITETVTTQAEDTALHRVSATHREARAFDVRVKGWLDIAANEFISHFEEEFGNFGAVGFKNGIRELIVRHEIVCGSVDEGDHFHVQLNRSFAIANPLAAKPDLA